jgi:hypothetical protein
VIRILEERLGCADLEAALTAPLEVKEKQRVPVAAG